MPIPQRKIIILDTLNEARVEEQANINSQNWDRVFRRDESGYRKIKDLNVVNTSKKFLVICEKD